MGLPRLVSYTKNQKIFLHDILFHVKAHVALLVIFIVSKCFLVPHYYLFKELTLNYDGAESYVHPNWPLVPYYDFVSLKLRKDTNVTIFIPGIRLGLSL